MELATMDMVAQMRDQLRLREDVLTNAKNAMLKELKNAPYLDAVSSFPALAVLENGNEEWIEPLARSLESNGACSLDAPIHVRSLHSALTLWKTNNRDQLVTIIIYGYMVENGSICHSPKDFNNILMICSN